VHITEHLGRQKLKIIKILHNYIIEY
jgi:hypothetical protein